jgi:Putative beta barrel porin-7 (BBP7)
MKIRWLSGVGLTLALGLGTAAAEDGWRPAGSQTAPNSSSTPVTPLSLGVSLGRPVPADAPADSVLDVPVADPNVSQASYQTPGSLPSVVRFQSPEVPKPLPPGPPAKNGGSSGADASGLATPVSKSTSGFATGAPSSAEPALSTFASDQPKTDAPVEAIPAPQPSVVSDPPEIIHDAGAGGSPSMTCDSSPCDCGCNDACCDPNRFYLSGEYLLWWIKDSRMPPLVTTGPVGGTGALGAPGTTVLFGGHVNNEERSGGRFTAGYWFNNDHTLALETTFFFLANRTVNFAANSSTVPVLARPFFNLNTGTEFAEITAAPGIATGTIGVRTFSHLWGADINLRGNIFDTCRWRFDLLGGFRYLNLREGINIQENILAAPTAPLFPGSTIVVTDDFNTRNQFYGGQLGFRLGWTRNRWSVDWLTKVALGDTHQVLNIQGSQLITSPAGVTTFANGGLLALGSNIGSFSRDRFAVVPETDLILGFQVRPHIKLLIGYSFLLWSDVVRPGNQIDRVIDVSKIPNSGLMVAPTGQNRPAPLFRGTDFWAQGISFGMEFVF